MTTRTCTGTRGLRTAAAVAVAMLAVLALPRAALAATSAVEMTDFEDNGYATRVLVKVSGRSGGPYYMCSPCSNGATATWGTTSVPFSTGDTLLISFQYRSGSSWVRVCCCADAAAAPCTLGPARVRASVGFAP